MKKLSDLKPLYFLFFPIFVSITLQTLSVTIDSVMLNAYDAEGTAAIGVATSLMALIGPMFFAITTGVNSFTVQYFASQKMEKLKQLMGVALTIIGPIIFVSFLIMTIFEQQLMGFLTDLDTSLGQKSVEYFRIIKFSVFLMPIEMLFTHQYRAIKKPKITLYIGLIQMISNIIFNFIFIYGINGIFEYGIAGAALATVLSKVVYIVINYFYSMHINSPFIGTIKEMFNFKFHLLKRVVSITAPLIFVEGLYGASMFLKTKVMLMASPVGFGAYIIANRITMMVNGFVIAPASVSGITMGEAIVARDDIYFQKQLNLVKKFLISLMVILGLITFFLLPLTIRLFNVGDEKLVELIYLMILLNGIYMVIRVPVASMIAMLKSGGDNNFVILLDGGITIFITIPLMFIGVYFGFGVLKLNVILILDMVMKLAIGYGRIKSKKWRNIL